MYEAYKPLRNRLRKANLIRGLQAVWHLYAYQSSMTPLPVWLTPAGFRHGQDLGIQGWQLLLLARELLINASMNSNEQFTWPTVASALNELAAIQEAISKVRYIDENGSGTAWWDMHAVVHQQIPLQRKPTIQRLIRYDKIFGAETLNSHLVAKVGLTFDECVLLSFIMVGAFERDSQMFKHQDYEDFGISQEKIQKFYNWVSSSPAALRQTLIEKQRFDENWAYTWNALEGNPLITFEIGKTEMVICPLPTLLWNRLSTSIFFDLFKEDGFTNAYGDAFEAYIGQFAKFALPGPAFHIVGDSLYKVGKAEKLGIDWVITDHQSNLLVECKTKRVKVDAKTLNVKAVLEDLEILADAVVQSYKNALDLKDGKSNVHYNGKRCYLMVVTLEDWYLISLKATEQLREHVLAKLTRNGINAGIIDEIPYAVISCEEYEKMLFAVRVHGIDLVLSDKSINENIYVPMDVLLLKYPEEIRGAFNDTYKPLWNELMGRITQRWNPEYRSKLNAEFSPI